MSDPVVDFGACCCCGRGDVRVRNIVMTNRPAPVPGTGWGCMKCGLPLDGAIFLACDRCASDHAQPVEVCYGPLYEKKRLPVDHLDPARFDHDMSRHPEAVR